MSQTPAVIFTHFTQTCFVYSHSLYTSFNSFESNKHLDLATLCHACGLAWEIEKNEACPQAVWCHFHFLQWVILSDLWTLASLLFLFRTIPKSLTPSLFLTFHSVLSLDFLAPQVLIEDSTSELPHHPGWPFVPVWHTNLELLDSLQYTVNSLRSWSVSSCSLLYPQHRV